MPEKPPKMAKKNKKGYLLINLEATKLTFGALIMQIHVGSNSYFLKLNTFLTFFILRSQRNLRLNLVGGFLDFEGRWCINGSVVKDSEEAHEISIKGPIQSRPV